MTEKHTIIKPQNATIEVDGLKIYTPSLTEIKQSQYNQPFYINVKVKWNVYDKLALVMESLFRETFNQYRHMWE